MITSGKRNRVASATTLSGSSDAVHPYPVTPQDAVIAWKAALSPAARALLGYT
ncbi:hypothetical protein ABT218_24620 [Streptomyces sp. NPDC001455]|uniref:hypothetical protein n=1 Tax=Streptomyces sp. NPDC001455 TaxID=3154518 RepID=UPI003318CA7B